MIKSREYIKFLRSLAINGVMVIKNVLSSFEIESFIDEYDKALCKEFGIRSLDINFENVRGGLIPTLIHGIERSDELTKLFLNSELNNVLSRLFMNNLKILASDLSTFAGGSIFHRDINSHLPVYKMLIYLNDSYGQDNKFIFFPGSQFNSSEYSRAIWNLADNRARPMGLDGLNSLGVIDWTSKKASPLLPWSSLSIESGDIIIFDQRIIHGFMGQSKMRRLIAMSFAPGDDLLNDLQVEKSFPKAFEGVIRDYAKFPFAESFSREELYYLFLNTGMLMMNNENKEKWRIADHQVLSNVFLGGFSGRNIWESLTPDIFNMIKTHFFGSSPHKAHSMVFSRDYF